MREFFHILFLERLIMKIVIALSIILTLSSYCYSSLHKKINDIEEQDNQENVEYSGMEFDQISQEEFENNVSNYFINLESIETERAILRPILLEDATELSQWHSYIERLEIPTRQAFKQQGKSVTLLILCKTTEKIVGFIELSRFEDRHGKLSVNLYSREFDIALEAIKKILKIVFADLHFHKITSRNRNENYRVAEFLKKLRFKYDETVNVYLKEVDISGNVVANGMSEYTKIQIYSMLRQDYIDMHKKESLQKEESNLQSESSDWAGKLKNWLGSKNNRNQASQNQTPPQIELTQIKPLSQKKIQ